MVLTSLMIVAIAVGIGACMTALTVFRAMSGDPIPQKSSQLYTPQIDNWSPGRPPGDSADHLNALLSYIDVTAFTKAHQAKRPVTLTPDQKTPTAVTANYMGDEHALNTMGLKPIAGRNFTADEIETKKPPNDPPYSGLIVSRVLAEKVFPNQNALGKMIIFDSDRPAPIIGIVDRLQGPITAATGLFASYEENSVLVPYVLIGESNDYMVRVQPGQLDAVMKAAEAKLYALDENRILHSKSMQQVRADAYRGDHGLIVLLTCICLALLIVTAFGIIGLTSYWVAPRSELLLPSP